jgi:hypothetical protein
MVLVVRNDLQMGKGKMMAQVGLQRFACSRCRAGLTACALSDAVACSHFRPSRVWLFLCSAVMPLWAWCAN